MLTMVFHVFERCFFTSSWSGQFFFTLIYPVYVVIRSALQVWSPFSLQFQNPSPHSFMAEGGQRFTLISALFIPRNGLFIWMQAYPAPEDYGGENKDKPVPVNADVERARRYPVSYAPPTQLHLISRYPCICKLSSSIGAKCNIYNEGIN